MYRILCKACNKVGEQGKDGYCIKCSTKHEPEITYSGPLDIQVCVPKDWTDERVLSFTPICGLESGWQIRREGSKYLRGMPERNPCEKREGFVHIMLDV